MVTSDGYFIYQDTPHNRIIIGLPQTKNTIIDTITPISDRIERLTYDEESILLSLIKRLLEGPINA